MIRLRNFLDATASETEFQPYFHSKLYTAPAVKSKLVRKDIDPNKTFVIL
jgi:hypothetical protein